MINQVEAFSHVRKSTVKEQKRANIKLTIMLNLQQAIEIKESLLEYVKATYHFQDQNVQRAFRHDGIGR